MLSGKEYELTNHLGNCYGCWVLSNKTLASHHPERSVSETSGVLAVVTDRKVPIQSGSTNYCAFYLPNVVSYSDYYPFGMQMPDRNDAVSGYRYGFNGMEGDSEVKGSGNSYTTEFRQYDPRLGRWLSLDPLFANFVWQSPYAAFDNNPIYYRDPLGLAAEGGDEQGGDTKKKDPYVSTGVDENGDFTITYEKGKKERDLKNFKEFVARLSKFPESKNDDNPLAGINVSTINPISSWVMDDFINPEEMFIENNGRSLTEILKDWDKKSGTIPMGGGSHTDNDWGVSHGKTGDDIIDREAKGFIDFIMDILMPYRMMEQKQPINKPSIKKTSNNEPIGGTAIKKQNESTISEQLKPVYTIYMWDNDTLEVKYVPESEYSGDVIQGGNKGKKTYKND
jgi:RHS repeat-associated protein